jgi:hypothetical protein
MVTDFNTNSGYSLLQMKYAIASVNTSLNNKIKDNTRRLRP